MAIEMNDPEFPPIASGEPEPVRSTPIWRVEDLTKGGPDAEILHDGSIYRLRITSNRKLILTK